MNPTMNIELKQKTDEFSLTTFNRIMDIINVDTNKEKKVSLAQTIHKTLLNVFDNLNANITELDTINKKLFQNYDSSAEQHNTTVKNFLTFLNSIKYDVVEFGFYGIENLNYVYPLNKLSIHALTNISEDDKRGVKYKYCAEINNISKTNEFYLKNLDNIDILEDIKIFDEQNILYNFNIEICKINVKQENTITSEKTLPIFNLFNCNKRHLF